MSDDLSIPSPAAYRPPQRARGLSPDTKRRIMIAGGILGAVIVIGATATLFGRSTGQVPVIEADQRPVKVKPDNPGGMQIAGVNNEIFGDGDTTDGARLAPAAEAPNPAALRATETRATPRTETPPRVATRPEVTEAPPQAEPPTRQASTPTARDPAGTAHASSASAPVSGTQAAPKAPAPTAAPAQRTAIPSPAKPAATEPRPSSGGRVAVQLAAVQSQGAAQAEWVSLQRRLPELLGGRQPVFPRTERDGKTFWRVRTSGFSDVAEARGFCQRVRAKGAACAVAEF